MAQQNTKALTYKWAQIISRKYEWLQTYEKPRNLTNNQKNTNKKQNQSIFSYHK